jgi:hypothetical protein
MGVAVDGDLGGVDESGRRPCPAGRGAACAMPEAGAFEVPPVRSDEVGGCHGVRLEPSTARRAVRERGRGPAGGVVLDRRPLGDHCVDKPDPTAHVAGLALVVDGHQRSVDDSEPGGEGLDTVDLQVVTRAPQSSALAGSRGRPDAVARAGVRLGACLVQNRQGVGVSLDDSGHRYGRRPSDVEQREMPCRRGSAAGIGQVEAPGGHEFAHRPSDTHATTSSTMSARRSAANPFGARPTRRALVRTDTDVEATHRPTSPSRRHSS